jgi:membrane protein involved in colicin uptake
MSALEVSSKNDYDKVCNLSPAEAAAKREADAAAKAEADAAQKATQEADKAKALEAEADAQAKADATPERTPAQAAIGALQDAGRDDLMSVMAHIVTKLSVEDLAMVRDHLEAIIANATPAPVAVAA